MIRRAFLKRMATVALASGLLGSELLARVPEMQRVSGTPDYARELSRIWGAGLENLRNTIGVQYYGGTVWVEDAESVAYYGRRSLLLHDESIKHERGAVETAKALLDEMRTP